MITPDQYEEVEAERDALRAEVERCNKAMLQYEHNIREARSELDTARAVMQVGIVPGSYAEAVKELATVHRKVRDLEIAASMEPMRIAEARALALEEAAQVADKRVAYYSADFAACAEEHREWTVARIRSLAPLPSNLVAVEQRLMVAIVRLLFWTVSGNCTKEQGLAISELEAQLPDALTEVLK